MTLNVSSPSRSRGFHITFNKMDVWFRYQLYFGCAANYVKVELPDNASILGVLESIAAAGLTEHRVKVGDCDTSAEVSDKVLAKTSLSSCLRTKGNFNPALLYELSAVGPGRQEHVDRLLSQYRVLA